MWLFIVSSNQALGALNNGANRGNYEEHYYDKYKGGIQRGVQVSQFQVVFQFHGLRL